MDPKKFKELDLHGSKHDLSLDNNETPFVLTAELVEESHDDRISHCCFNFYIPWGETQILASVGEEHVHVYEVPIDVNILRPIYSIKVSVPNSKELKEDLYRVTWALDTYEASRNRMAHRIVVGGALKQIHIIDASNGVSVNRIDSLGGCVNDIRTSPTNSNLIAVACQDHSAQIFHIRNDSCLIVIGGLHSHRDQVLSVDWSYDSKFLLTCGLDHMVMKWDLSPKHVQKHLEDMSNILSNGKMNTLKQDLLTSEDIEIDEKLVENSAIELKNYHPSEKDRSTVSNANGITDRRKRGCLLPIYSPVAVCSDMHEDYVDCIRQLGDSPYILSKGTGHESVVSLWRFGPVEGVEEIIYPAPGIMKTHTRLKKFKVPNGDVWFIQFEVDPLKRWLVVGADKGIIHVYPLTSSETGLSSSGISPSYNMKLGNSCVRCSSFSSGGRILVVVGGQKNISRFDRVPRGVNPKNSVKPAQK